MNDPSHDEVLLVDPLNVLDGKFAVPLRPPVPDGVGAGVAVDADVEAAVALRTRTEEDVVGRLLRAMELIMLKVVDEMCVEFPGMTVPLPGAPAVDDATGTAVELALTLGIPLGPTDPIARVEDGARVEFPGIAVPDVDVTFEPAFTSEVAVAVRAADVEVSNGLLDVVVLVVLTMAGEETEDLSILEFWPGVGIERLVLFTCRLIDEVTEVGLVETSAVLLFDLVSRDTEAILVLLLSLVGVAVVIEIVDEPGPLLEGIADFVVLTRVGEAAAVAFLADVVVESPVEVEFTATEEETEVSLVEKLAVPKLVLFELGSVDGEP